LLVLILYISGFFFMIHQIWQDYDSHVCLFIKQATYVYFMKLEQNLWMEFNIILK